MPSVTEAQIRWFRARRHHFVRPTDAVSACRDVLGMQSQQESTGLHALAVRTGEPVATLQSLLLKPGSPLVRTWGQRDTIHIYDVADWPLVIALRPFSSGGRRGFNASDEVMRDVLAFVEDLGRPFDRDDLLEAIPASYIREVEEGAQKARMPPERFAATRLVWKLASNGHTAIARKVGTKQTYVTVGLWHEPWERVDPADAARTLFRRYLRVNGPATVRDVAHHFGLKITQTKAWLDTSDLATVDCDGELYCDPEDVDVILEEPGEWPLRMLPNWETYLMGHGDKRWSVPVEAERKLVWKKAAMVSAVVLHEGKVVATWKQKRTKKLLKVTLEPLSGWSESLLSDLEKEAARTAKLLGIAGSMVIRS